MKMYDISVLQFGTFYLVQLLIVKFQFLNCAAGAVGEFRLRLHGKEVVEKRIGLIARI